MASQPKLGLLAVGNGRVNRHHRRDTGVDGSYMSRATRIARKSAPYAGAARARRSPNRVRCERPTMNSLHRAVTS